MAGPYASIYLHGWDVVDEGVDNVLKNLKDFGFNSINLAVSYHSGRYILPHNPKWRIFFAEEGVVYFEPHNENYVDTILKPKRSERYGHVDILSQVIEGAERYGMKVNAWTVCHHNSSFVRQHPEVGIIDPYLNVDYNWMCPNNPDVRNYVKGLVRDLASNYDLNTIQLESATFPWGIVHMDHHETFEVYVEPMVSHLYSTCFCKYCVEKARTLGFDLAGSREKLKDIIEDSLHTSSYILHPLPKEDLYSNFYSLMVESEEIQELLRYKFKVVQEIFKDIKEVLKEANPKVKLSVITGPASRLNEGVSFLHLDGVVDAFNLMVYYTNPEQVYYHLKWAKRLTRRSKIYASLRVNYPVAFSPQIIEGEINAAINAGADGIDFYNYGRTPLENLRWIGEALSRVK